ncbi:hypothetical protein [Rhizobium sp. AN5]|uniref:hypothetical protein n=1 Tax=Rhizobium sp. AN5 TaxID=1855304 RepID=UPI00269B5869|nr:hypothetical protein [Rhizobium sp. AN5]
MSAISNCCTQRHLVARNRRRSVVAGVTGDTAVAKIMTVPKSTVGNGVARLDDEDIVRLNQAVLVFLGLALSPRTKT